MGSSCAAVFLILLCNTCDGLSTNGACVRPTNIRPFARVTQPMAAAKKPRQGKVVSDPLGSTDASGYRRGSLGIGPNESKVLWIVVGLALIFGVDDETAQQIGAAQREMYPPSFSREYNARVDGLTSESTSKISLYAAKSLMVKP